MKKSEKVLLGVFAALFFGIALIGGGAFALRHYLEVRDEVDLLRDRLASMNLAVAQGADWAARSVWLEENAPRFTSNKDASAKLLERVSNLAQTHGLMIGTTELLEPARGVGADGLPLEDEEESHFDKAAIRTILTGVSEQALFAWLHDLQKPQSFLGVTRLQINPTGSDKTVNVEVEFTQFYYEKAVPKVTKAN
ncbi:MAG: hypothetical protein R3F13_19900 [Prosthecobacter sp.]